MIKPQTKFSGMKKKLTIFRFTERILIIIALGILWGLPRVIAQEPYISWQNCYNPIHQFKIAICPYSGGYFTLRSGEQKSTVVFHGFLGYPDIEIIRFDSVGNKKWKKSYGGSHYEYVVQMLEYSKNRYYVLGGARSNDGDVQSGNKGEFDIWLFAIDTTGSLLWEKTYGTAENDYPVRMAKLPDGSLVVCANIDRQGGDVDTAYGGKDMWFFRVDSLGNILWQKTLGAEGDNECTDFIVNDKGHIVLTGTNVGDLFSGCYAPTNQNIILMEIDQDGKIIWNRCYGSWSNDNGGIVAQCQDGYVFAGRVYGDGEYVEGYHRNPHAYLPTSDIWLVRTDGQGLIRWKRCLGGSNGEKPVSLIADEAGDIYLFGNTTSEDYDIKRQLASHGTNKEIWMVKCFTDGGIIYKRCFGGGEDDELSMKSSVIMQNDRQFILAASVFSSMSGDVACENLNSLPPMWLVKIERCDQYEAGVPSQPEGDTAVYTLSEPQTEYKIQPAENNWRFDWELEPSEAGKITNLGLKARVVWKKRYNGEAFLRARAYSACGYSEWTKPLKINVEEAYGITENAISGIKLYPNPTSGPVTLQLPPSGPFTLTLRDISGRILSTQEATGGTHHWDATGLQAGMYIMEISNPNGLSTRIKLLIAR